MGRAKHRTQSKSLAQPVEEREQYHDEEIQPRLPKRRNYNVDSLRRIGMEGTTESPQNGKRGVGVGFSPERCGNCGRKTMVDGYGELIHKETSLYMCYNDRERKEVASVES